MWSIDRFPYIHFEKPQHRPVAENRDILDDKMRLLVIFPLVAALGAADIIHLSLATATIGIRQCSKAFANVPLAREVTRLVQQGQDV